MQALADVARHVAHLTMIIARNPFAVMLMFCVQLSVGDCDLLKAEFETDLLDEV